MEESGKEPANPILEKIDIFIQQQEIQWRTDHFFVSIEFIFELFLQNLNSTDEDTTQSCGWCVTVYRAVPFSALGTC